MVFTFAVDNKRMTINFICKMLTFCEKAKILWVCIYCYPTVIITHVILFVKASVSQQFLPVTYMKCATTKKLHL